MDNTPRLRSAYPTTPNRDRGHPLSYRPPPASEGSGGQPKAQRATIPYAIIDAPTQRLYVSLLYLALMVWRFYDLLGLHYGTGDGFFLFTKWIGIDTVFLYGLSSLQIPWLQWSQSTFTVLFVAHAALNWVLMFQIPIPVLTWLAGLTRIFYDRELAVSERRVKPASVLHNSTLILGKQIINILPEGSAILNPNDEPFCVGSYRPRPSIPIQINQTLPILIELLRIDIASNEQEVVSISGREVRRMKRAAERDIRHIDPSSPLTIHYEVKRTGWYRLQRVVDESKLDVQTKPSNAVVVRCPEASVQKVFGHKCVGELSDFNFTVDASPPVKVKYSKVVDREDLGHTVLHIHPDHLHMPPTNSREKRAMQALMNEMDASWAKTQSIQIPMNESLGASGGLQYSLEDVTDGFGNVARYSHEPSQQQQPYRQLEQHFSVHERPKIAMDTCDAQHPIKVERGKTTPLPFRLGSAGLPMPVEGPFIIAYLFTPLDDLLPGQRHSHIAEEKEITMKSIEKGLEVKEPGLYTLTSVSSKFCVGEVLEPSSCVLLNPPEPDLDITTEEIPDKCAGKSIGLKINLVPLGNPPFRVHYTVKKSGGQVTPKQIEVNRLNMQVELRPPDTGHYIYEFTHISDEVYRTPKSLVHKALMIEQDIKAPPSAYIFEADYTRKACLGESVDMFVQLVGEAPFKLEYEIVHRGKRATSSIDDIQDTLFTLKTEALDSGGEHVVVLTSLTDKSGCKTVLQSEANVDVSPQRPRAAFGMIDGRRAVSALEGRKVNLPLRFQGEAPWTLYYHREEDADAITAPLILQHSNDQMEVRAEGTYVLTEVRDRACPGDVDQSSDRFTLKWVPRPEVIVRDGPSLDQRRGAYVKREVCQGDEDAVDISFTGTAPFNYEYEQRLKPLHGSQAVASKKFTSGLIQTSIGMETSEAGLYEYKITKLSDSSYNYDQRKFSPVLIQQQVHARPSASFVNPGRTYRYCLEDEASSEVIPIRLTGRAPYQLELEIKHHAISKSEIITLPNIDSDSYKMQVPHRLRRLGSHSVAIRKVQDARGCQQHMDRSGPQVHVSIAELPSISPLEDRRDYCIGDHISFALSGTPPFDVRYTFENRERKASVADTDFRRIAEKPGDFVITSVSDQRSTEACRARTDIVKVIHEMPSVRVNKGRTSTVGIHEGGEAAILFEFGGTPPFHFTYTRSARPYKGKKQEVLETKNEVSHDYSMTVRASAPGVYEVVSIRDHYCSFSTQQARGRGGQKLLTNG